MSQHSKNRVHNFALLITGLCFLVPGVISWMSILIAYAYSEIYLLNLYSHIPFTLHFLFGVAAPVVSSVLLFAFDHHLNDNQSQSKSLQRLTDILIVVSNLSILIGIGNFILRCLTA